VKRKGLSVLLFLLGAVFTAQSSESQPVNVVQLMAWLTAGVPGSRLARLVQERGIANLPNPEQIRKLESAGADASLAHTLNNLKLSAAAGPASSAVPAVLLRAAADARAQRFHQAELDLRQVVSSDPQNAALHFALGAMLRQQERWDDAIDEITLSAQLMPDFPENHSTLAYIFYRLDDPSDAIAEARTALSMDPANAEAYRYLGLALYAGGHYDAALHAFDESLAREPAGSLANADVYFDIGITHRDRGDLRRAAIAYRHALSLRPGFWEAHTNLGVVLHDQGKLDEAIAEYRSAKRLKPDEASVRNNLGNTLCDK
jgi:tetratricopeptide (TPR) repeat protein